MSFIERAVTVVITAGAKSDSNPNPATFGPNKSNTITLAGYRASAFIDYPGGLSMVSAQISIFGMSLSDMNAVASVANVTFASNNNTVTVLAGDANSGMSLVFQGTLQTAVVNTSASPRISFDMTAFGGYGLAMTPVPPSSYSGAANVATIMSNIAAANGMRFENNGVTTVLSNPYLSGTCLKQIRDCAQHAGINYVIDSTKGGVNGTLAIWPKFGSRNGAIPSVGPSTGLIGYPRYTSVGVDIDMIFNPNLLFGGQIKVQSALTPAVGTWTMYSISHNLESLTKGGDWMTTASCYSPTNAQSQLGIAS